MTAVNQQQLHDTDSVRKPESVRHKDNWPKTDCSEKLRSVLYAIKKETAQCDKKFKHSSADQSNKETAQGAQVQNRERPNTDIITTNPARVC